MKVDYFIDEERCWDANKLGEVLISDNVDAIQNIPLTRTPRKDTKS